MNPSLVAGSQSDKHVKNSSGKVFKTWVRIPLPPLSTVGKTTVFECTLNTRSLMHTCTLSKTVVFGDLHVNKKWVSALPLQFRRFIGISTKTNKVYQINTS